MKPYIVFLLVLSFLLTGCVTAVPDPTQASTQAASPTEETELDIDLQGFGATLEKHIELYSDDLKATNTKDESPVMPTEKPVSDKVSLAKHSWNMLVYKY